jgi:hypothetical protein
MTERDNRDREVAPPPFRALDANGLPVSVPGWWGPPYPWPTVEEARGIVLLVLEKNAAPPAGLIGRLREEATVLVFGPADEPKWRLEALAAGGFACMSSATPPEDRRGLLLAAIQHQSALREIQNVRGEAERICLGLVESFASAMERLDHAKGEARRILDVLEELRLRIVQTLM